MSTVALDLLFAPLLPVLLVQGYGVRRKTLRLPPAAGPVEIMIDGALPVARVLLIGESTVAGVGAATHAEALAGHLAADLKARTGRRIECAVFGLSGATVGRAHASLLPAIPATEFDLIVVAFGVNDVLERTASKLYADRVRKLIAAVRDRIGGAPVLIAAVPPMARFPALPQPLRAYFGARAALLDREVRRTSIIRAAHVAAKVRIEPHLFAPDRFHPSPAGYRVWAQTLGEAAVRISFVKQIA